MASANPCLNTTSTCFLKWYGLCNCVKFCERALIHRWASYDCNCGASGARFFHKMKLTSVTRNLAHMVQFPAPSSHGTVNVNIWTRKREREWMFRIYSPIVIACHSFKANAVSGGTSLLSKEHQTAKQWIDQTKNPSLSEGREGLDEDIPATEFRSYLLGP